MPRPVLRPATPLPRRRVAVLCLVLFATECNTWLLYSYLPFLVQFVRPGVAPEEIGYWSALLGFAYYAGALVGNFWWGVLADRVGRRPILLTGVMGSGMMSCVFGFSRGYWLCVILRFLWGMMNTVGVCRTTLMEILDESNSAQGMVLFSVVSGLGRIVGPLIGTLTARPALHYHIFRHSIYADFPFALPALLSFFWSMVIWVLAYADMEETLPSHRIKSLSSLLNISDTDNTYSILGSSSLDDNELDISLSPDRCRVDDSPTLFSSMSAFTTRKGEVGNSFSQDKIVELKSNPISSNSRANDNEMEDNFSNSENSTNNSNGHDYASSVGVSNNSKEKKGVTFNSFVQMKVIDTSDIQYKKLKKVTEDDKPLFYSAKERDSDYSRSSSYLAAVQGEGGSLLNQLDDRSLSSHEEEDDDMDLDASTRSLFSNFSSESESSGVLEKYTNGSELLQSEEAVRDFRHLNFFGILRVLTKSKLIYYTSWTYFLLVAASSSINEVVPLWLVVPSSSGGFGFNSFLLGVALFCSGPVSLGMQLCVFPSVVHQSGLLPLIRSSLLVFSILVTITPAFCIPAFQQVPVMPKILVILSFSAMTVAADWALVIAYVFINNSCYGYQRATVNGFMQAIACLAMMLASLGGSAFFALCESNSLKDRLPWPFHYAIVFWTVALLSNASRQTTYYLHRKIQKARREPKFPRYAIQMENFSIENTGIYDSNDNDDNCSTR